MSWNVTVDVNGVEDMMDEILAISNGLDDLNPILTQMAIDITREMQTTGRFEDRSGNLRRSMMAYVEDNALKIRMLYYGYFLSFGTREGSQNPLTAEVAIALNPEKAPGSYFNQPDNNAGIAARGFYPIDIQDMLIDRLEAIVLNNLEN